MLRRAPADDHTGEDVLAVLGQHILRENHYPHCSTMTVYVILSLHGIFPMYLNLIHAP
jgi:hypothetical protein